MEKKYARLRYHGEGGALFGLVLVNALLTMITLGIYSFWGRTKVRQFHYNETEMDGDPFVVADARDATCIASEGELPFTAEPGWTIFSVDFRSPTGRVASLQREKNLSSFYDGRYVTLAELRPRNLRAIEGWPTPAFGG